mgnify:CR=1 FL=1
MIKTIIILGSTGSIGSTTLASIYKKNFKVKLLSSKSNIKKLYNQAIRFNVKDVIIEDSRKYNLYKKKFNKKKIRLHLGLKNINNKIYKKVDFCVNAISGIDGLFPTLKIIPYTKFLLIANKESIICGWELILKNLKKNKTEFIPLDSEHFSIWSLLKNEDTKDIQKIVLTASGGPFLNKSKSKLINIKPELALKHPKWKMGKKISIDSSNLMNKIFEFIEAKKIFNINKKNISILIHPESFIHAVIYFKGDLIKSLAHNTSMKIPISNALGIKKSNSENNINKYLLKLNNLKFKKANDKNFPLLKIIKFIPDKSSYFETILITINDYLVNKYLEKKINYISIQLNILKLLKKPYFAKYYKLKPKNIYDIKKMIKLTKKYVESNYKYYEK